MWRPNLGDDSIGYKKLIGWCDTRTWHRSILSPLLRLTPPTEGSPWDDPRKILHGGQGWLRYKIAKNVTESFNSVSRAHERYRRQMLRWICDIATAKTRTQGIYSHVRVKTRPGSKTCILKRSRTLLTERVVVGRICVVWGMCVCVTSRTERVSTHGSLQNECE